MNIYFADVVFGKYARFRRGLRIFLPATSLEMSTIEC
jgi:hypothetical protein